MDGFVLALRSFDNSLETFHGFYEHSIYLLPHGGTMLDDGSAIERGPCVSYEWRAPLEDATLQVDDLRITLNGRVAKVGTPWPEDAQLEVSSDTGVRGSAFAVRVRTPHTGTVDSPSFTGQLQISRSHDFELQWSNVAADEMVVMFDSVNPANDHETVLVCRFAASTGRGSVPTAALAAYPAPAAGLYVVATNRELIDADGYAIGIVAESTQTWRSASDAFSEQVAFAP